MRKRWRGGRTAIAAVAVPAPTPTPTPTPTGYHPTLLDEPTLSGTAQVGETLSITGDTWANADGTVAFTYQWYRGRDPIDGATSATYDPVSADEFHYLRCTKTGTNDTGSWTAYSPFTALVLPETVADHNFGWGEQTSSGYGGRPIGVGVTITGGNTGSDFTIDDLGELVASGTYGAAKTYAASIYDLTLSNGETAHIKIIARRHDFVSRLGSASNNDVYTGGGTSFQLRNILARTSGTHQVVLGDEIYDVGTRYINPETVDCRLAPLSGGYSGSGRICVFNMHAVQLTFHASTEFDIPIDFVKPTFYNNNAASGSGLMLGYVTNGYGWQVFDGTFACGDDFSGRVNCDGIRIRGSGNVERCTFTNMGHGVVPAAITDMENGDYISIQAIGSYQDACIHGRWHGAGQKILNVFARDQAYAEGAHGDLIQHLGFSDGNDHPMGEIGFSMGVRNVGAAGHYDFQILLMKDSSNGSTLSGVNIHHLIGSQTYANGILLVDVNTPTIEHCLTLYDVGNNSSQAAVNSTMYTTGSPGSGGHAGFNVSNNDITTGFSGQTGMTFDGHSQLANTQGALDGAFVLEGSPTALLTRGDVLRYFTPLPGGSLRRGDNRFNGPILPNGCWNMKEVMP